MTTEQHANQINATLTRLLAMREHSARELLQKLKAKGYDEQLCQQQLLKFKQANLQDDRRFAEALIRGRVSKGKGELVIRAELAEHNIDSTDIEQALAEQQVDWVALAKQVYHKKFGQQLPGDWPSRQKCQRFLQYRGFSAEQIRYALQKEHSE